ncbi:helix-turn-helix domain-containing protein [Streptomyces aidingensis]|uniref:Helix-turn-helix domain-containing protein n=1 Tax=Streptomyces aidingensis TaxID=910347 RepID=A0A1I1LKL8_9ACTN|nr:helix-turn-helix domain-containing protein [Streptomyces aidingensis]SFC71518.1 Helix-turn-helix domain-containing protein [Streptomyces aidingensis]
MPQHRPPRSRPTEAEAIGERVRDARLRLGLTQADLAAELRRTQSWLSKVERGHQELDRTSVINELAAALHVHPNDLIERPYPAAADGVAWQRSASAIMRELRRYDLTPVFDGTPRPAAGLWRDMAKLHKLRDNAASTKILASLPDLLREARALAEAGTGREREESFAIYAIACKFAHTAAHALGHPELIAMACERAAWASRLSGDELLPAVADWMRVWDMWATADWDDSLALSDKALRHVEPHYRRGDPAAVRLWGSLHLRAAVSAARAGRDRGAEARHRIEQAGEAAERLPRMGFDRHSLTFSPGNVRIHAVNIALELTQHDEALRLHQRMPASMVTALPRSRRGHYRLDVARAYLWTGDRDRALTELEEAERTAPQLIRNHPIARATLRRIRSAERAGVRERLRLMSARFHLDE